MENLQEIIYFGIAIIGAVSAVILWITRIQKKTEIKIARIEAENEAKEKLGKQIQNLKDNDLHTITGKLKELDEKMDRHIVENTKNITEIKTILNERLK